MKTYQKPRTLKYYEDQPKIMKTHEKNKNTTKKTWKTNTHNTNHEETNPNPQMGSWGLYTV